MSNDYTEHGLEIVLIHYLQYDWHHGQQSKI